MCTPQNASIKNSAVLKAIWQSTDIDRTALAKFMHSHLNFFVPLYQNFCSLIRKHILLALSEVNRLCCICKNKVIFVFFPVILIVV